jgi:hypothetical protein
MGKEKILMELLLTVAIVFIAWHVLKLIWYGLGLLIVYLFARSAGLDSASRKKVSD